MDIAEFVLARVAEDEAAARIASQRGWAPDEPVARWRYDEDEGQRGDGNGKGCVWNGVGQATASTTWHDQGAHIARWDPARVLAECEAKRAIVRSYQLATYDKEEMEWILDCLAFPYSDHRDYDPAWAPWVAASH